MCTLAKLSCQERAFGETVFGKSSSSIDATVGECLLSNCAPLIYAIHTVQQMDYYTCHKLIIFNLMLLCDYCYFKKDLCVWLKDCKEYRRYIKYILIYRLS